MTERLSSAYDSLISYLIETRYAVKDPNTGKPLERTWQDLVERFKKGFNEVVNRSWFEPKIYDLSEIIKAIENKYVIPASPFLMSFGNPYTQRKGYFSCYPLGYVEDSMDGIYDTIRKMRDVYVRGGGVGIDVSKLRPKNAPVDNKQGISSGPVGFLPLFDAVTGTTNQGGRRRGALLVQMHYTHPDVKKFIRAKTTVPILSQVIYSLPQEERSDVPLQNLNLSVVIDANFWENHNELLNDVATQAWKTGDPGLLFLDNMIRFSPFNPKYYGIEHLPAFSNPCGEYLAPANTACNLITVNVAKIAYDCLKNGSFDFNLFYKKVFNYGRIALNLGNLILNLDEGYPLEEIRLKTQELRPVGVGMTGFHTALLLAYDGDVKYGEDEESIKFAQNTQVALSLGTLYESSRFTEFFGKTYKWNEFYLNLHLEELQEVVDKESLPFKGELQFVVLTGKKHKGFYNSVTTSQPPTGSVSLFAGIAGDTGIEPTFAVELVRNVRDFYTNEWKQIKLTTLYLAEKLTDKEFRKKVENQLAYQISPKAQLRILEAFQRFIHTGISKTINVPESTTIEDVIQLIKESKNARLKGFTIYRENCRADAVYVTEKSKKTEESKDQLPTIRKSFTYEVRGTVNAYVTTTFDQKNLLREVFISVGKAGTTLNGMFQAFGRVISIALRKHPELINDFIKTLKGIETGEFYNCADLRGKSLPDVIAKIMEDSLQRITSSNSNLPKEENDPDFNRKKLQLTQDLCPICGNLSVIRTSNCKACTKCDYVTC